MIDDMDMFWKQFILFIEAMFCAISKEMGSPERWWDQYLSTCLQPHLLTSSHDGFMVFLTHIYQSKYFIDDFIQGIIKNQKIKEIQQVQQKIYTKQV